MTTKISPYTIDIEAKNAVETYWLFTSMIRMADKRFETINQNEMARCMWLLYGEDPAPLQHGQFMQQELDLYGARSILDVVGQVLLPEDLQTVVDYALIFDGEIQNEDKGDDCNCGRALDYASRLLASQKNRNYKSGEYDKLQKEAFGPYRAYPGSYDRLDIIFVYLAKREASFYEGKDFSDLNKENVIHLLEAVFSDKISAEEKIHIYKNTFYIDLPARKDLKTMQTWAEYVDEKEAQGELILEQNRMLKAKDNTILDLQKRIEILEKELNSANQKPGRLRKILKRRIGS